MENRGRRTDWKTTVLGFALLLVLLFGAFYLLQTMWNALFVMPPEVAAAFTAATSTILVPTLAYVFNRTLERRREMEVQVQKQKLPVYEEVLAFWFRMLMQDKPGIKKATDVEIVRYLAVSTPKLILWGGDEVMREYSAFKDGPASRKVPNPGGILQFERVLFAIRKDLGFSNKNLAPGDLVACFSSDVGKHPEPEIGQKEASV